MSKIRFLKKITLWAKNQENLNVNERRKSIDVKMEVTHMGIFDKYLKADLIKMLQLVSMIMPETKGSKRLR